MLDITYHVNFVAIPSSPKKDPDPVLRPDYRDRHTMVSYTEVRDRRLPFLLPHTPPVAQGLN